MAKRRSKQTEPKEAELEAPTEATTPETSEPAAATETTSESTEAEAPAEADPEPKSGQSDPAPTGPAPALILLRVFAAAGGVKWDQMAAFKHYATNQKLGPLSMKDWRAAYDAFLNRPIG